MWAIFIAVPAVTSIAAAFAKMMGGAKMATAGLMVTGWNLTHGHRPGEGRLTDRPLNNTYYAIEINIDSEYDLNRGLGVLAATLPVEFAPLQNKKFDMTISESELLRAVVIPAMAAIKTAHEAKEIFRAFPKEAEARQMAMQAYKTMREAVYPVALLLRQFPKRRVK